MSLRFLASQLAFVVRQSLRVVLKRVPAQFSKNVVYRLPVPKRIPVARTFSRIQFWRNIMLRNRQVLARLGGSNTLSRRSIYNRQGVIGTKGASAFMNMANEAQKGQRMIEYVRDVFKKSLGIFETDDWKLYPTSLDGYEIAGPINKGCNAVVFAANIKINSKALGEPLSWTSSDGEEVVSAYYGGTTSSDPRLKSTISFPIALKMMFNFNFPPNDDVLFREYSKELVPAVSPPVRSRIKRWVKTLDHAHPNVIKIYAAFVDEVRPFPDLSTICPAVLPSHINSESFGRSHTLYLVMRRFKMTLLEYLLTRAIHLRRRQLMVAQLMEAIRWLREQKVIHRDLKSNNVLLHFDQEDEDPLLVISDFGCCLADGGFTVPYFCDDVDLGGNLALRPPEVACVEPGYFSVVDFQKADLWSAGAIAFEIFCNYNPFYGRLRSSTYEVSELPQLPGVSPPVASLLYKVMQRVPKMRPSPECAANVLALSRFSAEFLGNLCAQIGLDKLRTQGWSIPGQQKISSTISSRSSVWLGLSEMTGLYAAETAIGRVTKRLSEVECILRAGFLSRVNIESMWDAVVYFQHRTEDEL